MANFEYYMGSIYDPKTKAFHFEETDRSVQVLKGLNSLHQARMLCDVTVCVDGQEFKCHRNVLASSSPYFWAMFTGELLESQQDCVCLNGIDASAFRQLVDYAYTSEIDITEANVQSLFSAADLLEILQVRDACCFFLEKNMDETNCLGIHSFAETHACNDLQTKAKTFVRRHFSEVATQDEFLKLPSSRLIELLSDDLLEVNSEEVVFEAVMSWHGHDPDARGAKFEKVLEHVRLPLLSPYYLYDRVEKVPIVRLTPACRELLEEAKAYHLLPDRRAELSSARTRFRKLPGMNEVIFVIGGEKDRHMSSNMACFCPHLQSGVRCMRFPVAISRHGSVVLDCNILYVAGGRSPSHSASNKFFKYDLVADSMVEMAPMLERRSELGLAFLDGYIYAVGGFNGSHLLQSVERYDPKTNSWQMVASMKVALSSPAVVSCCSMLYVMGGAIVRDGGGIQTVQRFNPRTDTWTEVAPMLTARTGGAACILNNHIYVIGGYTSTEVTDKVESYDPSRNEWRTRASMKGPRYRHGAVVVEEKIYVIGGIREKGSCQKDSGEEGGGEKISGEEDDGEKSSGGEDDGEKSSGEEDDGEKSSGEEDDGEKSRGKEDDGEKSSGEEGNKSWSRDNCHVECYDQGKDSWDSSWCIASNVSWLSCTVLYIPRIPHDNDFWWMKEETDRD